MESIKRDKYWDVVKGLGIIAIVLGHSGFRYGLILNMYHMALFFFVAGYLYNDRHTCNPKNYIIRKIKDLWVPLMKYTIIMIILHNVFIKLNIYSMMTNQHMIYPKEEYGLVSILECILKAVLTGNNSEELLGATWFVFPMLLTMITYCYIRNILGRVIDNKKIKELMVYITCWLGCILGMIFAMRGVKLTWRFDISLLCLAVVSCGYCYKIYGNREKLNIVVACASAVVLLYFNKRGLNISFAAGTIGRPIAFVLATFSGIYINLHFAKILYKFETVSRVVAYLGKNSFHIMALHFLGMKVSNIIDIIVHGKEIYNLSMFPYSNSDWWILNTVAGLFMPLLIVYGVQTVVIQIQKHRDRVNNIIVE